VRPQGANEGLEMPVILGPNGQPISSQDYARKKNKAPLVGEIATPWAGTDRSFKRLSGDNVLMFDTSRLKLSNFRLMRDHYQINSSLSVLTFMLHQMEWKIECDSAKVKKHVEWNLEQIWTRLVRAMSQSFWAGFSPNALQWENDIEGRRKVVTKVKDLYPEECLVHWKKVQGVASKDDTTGRKIVTPKINVYDGIDQAGFPTIPVENSFWYPLLMENGDYYGRKLLKSAFQPWYFSLLNHIHANRYFERFGEPVPVGRAPYDDVKDVNGVEKQGNILMMELMEMARSGVAVVLPNDKIQNGAENDTQYEYTLEYLESQMRGADFERHLGRLDEEISQALFTPVSAVKSTSEGYNSGVSQMQTYMMMLRAVAGDMKEYIDKYLLAPMAIQNFGPNAKIPTITFHRLGGISQETLKAVLVSLISGGKVKPNIVDLGQQLGLELEEIEEVVTEVDPQGSLDPEIPPEGGGRVDPRKTRPERTPRGKGTEKPSVAGKIAARAAEQHGSNRHSGTISLGHHRQVEELFEGTDVDVADFYAKADQWINALATVEDDIPEFKRAVEEGLVAQIESSLA
jgi:hypothetical protein